MCLREHDVLKVTLNMNWSVNNLCRTLNSRSTRTVHACDSGKQWNRIPMFVFPPAYDLSTMETGLSRHLFTRILIPTHIFYGIFVEQLEGAFQFYFFLSLFELPHVL